jgi:hypothetical protein
VPIYHHRCTCDSKKRFLTPSAFATDCPKTPKQERGSRIDNLGLVRARGGSGPGLSGFLPIHPKNFPSGLNDRSVELFTEQWPQKKST